MTKLRNAILALTASLLATGAFAQVGFVQDSEAVTVPEELFGGGAVELDFADFEDANTPFVPKAKLIFNGGTLTAGTEFNVTYTLHNAVLDERVVNKHFMWGTWGPANSDRGGLDCDTASAGNRDEGEEGVDPGTGNDESKLVFCEMADEIDFEREGGTSGDRSVTFDITIAGSGLNNDQPIMGTVPVCTTTTNENDPPETTTTCAGVTSKIVFLVPRVEATGLLAANAMGRGGKSVMVSTSIEQPKMGSGDSEVSESIMMGGYCGMTQVSILMGDALANAQDPCPVVNAHKVVTDISNSGGTGTISLDPDHMRMQLKPEGAVALSTIQVEASFASGVRTADGDPLETDFTGSMAGTLAISVVSERFNEGDVVYIDADNDKMADTGEQFIISNGVASDTVGLSTTAVTVLYQPSGEQPLDTPD